MTHKAATSEKNLPYSLTYFLLLITIYLLTLDTGLRPDELVGGDLITHQYAQVEARPSNAPGYPLYTMGGWLWFRAGTGLLGAVLNPVQVLSLYSTLWSLGSLAVLYLILRRIADDSAIAMLLTAFFAVTSFFWYYSVTTEQYTSAVFQTVVLVWLAFRWDESPNDCLLLAMAFVSGTMLANMVTTLFILPPLLWFIFSRMAGDRRYLQIYFTRPRLVMQAIAMTALPLLSYAYVYIRGAQHPEWRGVGAWESAWQWFVAFLTISQGRDELAPGLTLAHPITAEYPWLMLQEFFAPIALLGVVGIAVLGQRRAAFLYSTLVIYVAFCWAYRFGNWFQVIMPAYPLVILGLGAVATKIPRRNIVVAVLVGLVILRGATNWSEANQRHQPEDIGLNPGWAILADAPQTPAFIVATFEERVALQYLQTVWRATADITLVESIPDTHHQRYITRQAATPERLTGFYPQAAGLQLIALESEPRRDMPPTATPVDLPFGDALMLRGWERLPAAEVPTETPNWHIALYWTTTAPLHADYTVSVRPLLDGQPITTVDGTPLLQDHMPVWGTYPTSQWISDTIIRDDYALTLPVTPDAIQIIVYRTTAAGFENLAVHTLP